MPAFKGRSELYATHQHKSVKGLVVPDGANSTSFNYFK
jgi:hypothetical protein